MYYQSPLGQISVIASDEALMGIWLEGQAYYEAGFDKVEIGSGKNPILDQTKAWLDTYFSGRPRQPHGLPLAKTGTAFQEKVWSALDQVPFGQVWTYGQLADQISCRSPQAIGGALARNPWLILRPCHRIVKRDGQLGGYAGGQEAKVRLLELEGVRVDK